MGGVTIGSNISSLIAQRQLGKSTDLLNESSERLASGMRINRASDDAAGLAIATSLQADVRVFNQGRRNLNDGISYLNIAEGGLSELTNIVVRQKELAEQSANGVYSLQQRRALDSEANALVAEFNRILATTSFNDRSVLGDSTYQLRIQAGYGLTGGLDLALNEQLARTTGDGTVQAKVDYAAVGANITSVAAADMNKDGAADLVTIGNAFIGIALNNGDGTFRAPVSYSGGASGTVTLHVADLNNDGNLDVVNSIVSGSAFAMVYLGNADGSLRARASYVTGTNPQGSALGDFNEDGYIDILTANNGSSDATLLRGNGDGTFVAALTIASGLSNNTSSVEAGDFDNDGNLDFATSSNVTNFTQIFLGAGNGTFSYKGSYLSAAGNSARSVKASDLNNDGVLDLVTTSNVNQAVNVLIGNGDGSFKARTANTVGADLRWAISNDSNGDGYQDIVTADGSDHSIRLLIGNGDGTFSAGVSYAGPGTANLTRVATADFNRDGVLDIVGTSDIQSIFFGNARRINAMQWLNLNTQAGARSALDILDATLVRITQEKGLIGAYQSRIQTALNTTASIQENSSAAAGRIMDADIAEETSQLIRAGILQKAGASVLGQANQLPGLALQLLR